jgi:hypothetical protein
MNPLGRLSRYRRLSVVGLVVTAAGMLAQMVGGSELYPTVTGPIVLLASATLVALGPWSWVRFVALSVPLVLGIGAVVAAAMTGEFITQLTDTSRPAVLLGSVLHVAGLGAAIAGGLGLVVDRRQPLTDDR